MNLITFADVVTFKADANEAQTNIVIASVSRTVANALGQPLGVGYWSGTTEVQSTGGRYLRLPRYPLYEVESVFQGEDTEIEDWDQYDDGDRWGIIRRHCGWPYGGTRLPLTGDVYRDTFALDVTYSAGWKLPGQTDVPEGVEELPFKMDVIELVLNKIGRGVSELSGKHVAEERVGAMAIRYGAITAQTSASSAEAKILAGLRQSYRRPWCP